MRVASRLGLGILICSLLLVSCGGVTPIPLPTTMPMVSPMAMRTLTQIPTLTPTATSTQIPATPVFPALATPYQALFETPTSIAIPPSNSTNFKLKNWSEQNAIDLVRFMGQYAHDSDYEWIFSTRPGLDLSQEPLKLAVQEALWRFPDSSYREYLEWHLASPNFISGNQDSVHWVLKKLEDGLNTGAIDLDNMNAVLNSYGLGIQYVNHYPMQFSVAKNLFGDNSESKLFTIETTVYFSHFSYVVVVARSNPDKSISLIPVSFFSRRVYLSNPKFIDLTNDGIPEIIYGSDACAGSCHPDRAYIFHWQQDHFVEVTNGKIYNNEGNYASWKIGPVDMDRNSTLLMTYGVYFEHDPYLQETYKWDGRQYQLTAQSYIPPTDLASSLTWFLYALEHGEIDNLIPKVEQAITDTAKINLSVPDYFRFQLGFLYALKGDKAKVETVLSDLINNPINPQNASIPKAAESFLKIYATSDTLYLACQSANAILDEAIQPYKDKYGYVSDDDYLSVWGLLPDHTSNRREYYKSWCNLNAVVFFLAQNIPTSDGEKVPAMLENLNIPVLNIDQSDINLDGLNDWIVFVGEPIQGWVLLNDPQRGNFLPLRMTRMSQAFSEALASNPIVYLVNDDHHESQLVISAGNQVGLFKIVELETGPILQSYYDDVTPSIVNDRQAKHNEAKIAADKVLTNKFADSILVLEKYLSPPIEVCSEEGSSFEDYYDCTYRARDLPRFQYLLGLAYELDGGSGQAVKTYWQLWRNYPESPYALMARYKLEPVTP